ncbi:MAG TPA: S8 family serine peptidase, partial [Gaiellaceae bacterium]|nr:S8 family serine peptidase [Gaiellaceae bacterium]
APLPASAERSVIVTLRAPATAARTASLERDVGDFELGRRFTVIDTGIDAGHQDLDEGKVLAFKDFVNGRTTPYDDEGHGTHVAATIAGDGDGRADGAYAGVAPGAGLVGVKVLDANGGGTMADATAAIDWVVQVKDVYGIEAINLSLGAAGCGDGTDATSQAVNAAHAAGLVGVKVLDANGGGTMADVTAAIDWVVQVKDTYGIDVINLSLGAAGCGDGTDATSQAVNAAHAAGLVVAVAAGNEGPGTCTIGAPGAAADGLTVGAMADTAAGGFALASFSSRGPTADGRMKPDVTAPGVDIGSAQAGTTNGYVAYSGTSMATPFTAGVALLMREANGGLTPQQVKDAMVSTALDWGRGGDNRTAGTSGRDIDYGAGRLDAYAALKAAGAPLADGPATPAHKLFEGSLSTTGARAEYKLEVGDARFPVAATLVMPAIAGAAAYTPDFDLYLYDPAGNLVGRAETVARQETVQYRPTTTGTYTLLVYSYSGGGAYFVDVSAGLATATGTPAGDTIAPTIGSVSPADGATGVAAGSNVSVAFSEAMNAASAQAAFSLVRSSDGAPVSGSFAWSGDTLTFDPSSSLAAGTEYTAKVTTAAQDKAGNALAADQVWKFRILTTVTAYPSSTAIYAGKLRSGDASRLRSDNDSYYQVSSTTSGTRVSDWYGVTTSVSNALTSLKVTYKGKNSASCSQTISVYNWTTGYWVQLDSRTVGTSEVSATVGPSGTLADYVSGTSGDGDVAVRIRCARSDSTSFYASGDLMKVVYEK